MGILGQKEVEELLQEPGWFVDKLHELVPTSSPRAHPAITLPAIKERLPLPSLAANHVVRLSDRSLVDLHIRRRKKKHARRIAAAVAADSERKIRVDER
jgi:hypothetical protein